MYAVVTSRFARKQQQQTLKQKREIHTHTSSYIHSNVNACTQTQKDRFTLSAHFLGGGH